MNFRKVVQALILSSLIAGCGGGGGESTSEPADIAGVWSGTFTYNIYICIIFACVFDHTETRDALALAAADGEIHLLPWDVQNSAGLQPHKEINFVGHLDVVGNTVSGELDRVGKTCLDSTGSSEYITDHAVISASLASGQSFDGSWNLDRCFGDGVFNLDYDPASDDPASFESLEGLWSLSGLAISISEDGLLSGSNSEGCQFSGSANPASSAKNIYDFEVAISNCPVPDDPSVPLPLGGSFSGLGSILPNSFGGRVLIVSLFQQNDSAVFALRQ
jgi:hypothetical protein